MRSLSSFSIPFSARTTIRNYRRIQWSCAVNTARRCQSSDARVGVEAVEDHPEKPFYVTTPIFYVNADPHIGHLHSMLVGDIIKRWQLMKGRKAILCTGVDEHGMKIQQAAAKADTDPGPFCDKGADQFKALAAHANVQYDHFVRTTAQDHRNAVEYAWHKLKQKDMIYTSKHEGWYSVSDETFYPEKNVHLVIEPSSGRKMMASIETGKEVEWTSETNFHFRLSEFKDPLLKFYEANPDWMIPKSRYREIISEVDNGLSDLSISRPSTRLDWGIRVPDDPSQTIYVWLDALTNYITKAGYPWKPSEEHSGGWPADVQIIGKDITRFHCIYWPAFLMALDLPLPKRFYTHSHWLLGNQKMSKSVGNVVNPFFAIDRFGVDPMRFYMAYAGKTTDDQSYANEFIYERYQKLKDSLGNLASRVLRGRGWQRQIPDIIRRFSADSRFDHAPAEQFEKEMYEALTQRADEADVFMQDYDVRGTLMHVFELVLMTNRYFHLSKPWGLVSKDPAEPLPDKVGEIIYLCMESIRIQGILLMPFIPGKANQLLDNLGVAVEKRTFQHARLGADGEYGVPIGKFSPGLEGVLFPPIPPE